MPMKTEKSGRRFYDVYAAKSRREWILSLTKVAFRRLVIQARAERASARQAVRRVGALVFTNI